MADLFSLSGQDKCGLAWYVDGKQRGTSFYARVQVGSTIKVTNNYNSPGEAEEAGVQLAADTLAELVDYVASSSPA